MWRLLDSGLVHLPLHIDSHQHTHHIFVVSDALHDTLTENDFSVEYTRNSREPLSVYLRKPGIFLSCGLANIIKCILLNSTLVSLR
ncbi:hypothetical protein [Breznakiella homolactica]|uniref:hypothetical protein n=1 Tax=Breznakiella homolactica TaxID=2798577 RepID=UPI003D805BA5